MSPKLVDTSTRTRHISELYSCLCCLKLSSWPLKFTLFPPSWKKEVSKMQLKMFLSAFSDSFSNLCHIVWKINLTISEPQSVGGLQLLKYFCRPRRQERVNQTYRHNQKLMKIGKYQLEGVAKQHEKFFQCKKCIRELPRLLTSLLKKKSRTKSDNQLFRINDHKNDDFIWNWNR